MTEKREILLRFDDDKLMDVVKNYKQYGYDDQLRQVAIDILQDRGITRKDLMKTGNFDNKTYHEAVSRYHSFVRNSTIAFIAYLMMFPLISEAAGVSVIAFFVSFIFLFRSFKDQERLCVIVGQPHRAQGHWFTFSWGYLSISSCISIFDVK